MGGLNSTTLVIYINRLQHDLSLHTGVRLTVDTFIIAGYVQKITTRNDIEVMEDLDNGKPG